MIGATPVLIDARVLANFSLCDTLLRLAEPPRLFDPKWSEDILREATCTLELKLGWPSSLVAHFQAELRSHFREAWVEGYEALIPTMTNDQRIAMWLRQPFNAVRRSLLPLTYATSRRHIWIVAASAQSTLKPSWRNCGGRSSHWWFRNWSNRLRIADAPSVSFSIS